ncbi:hypothetical protein CRG98_036450 [Punica granatum]|uniref:Uncharacterized protein n=1 Tax=Punica granatum TaxID=22663 RepID=A0A2I0IGM2_PUNGR|nr:hypothetical protein CRG98_036450 [Punica granatum]
MTRDQMSSLSLRGSWKGSEQQGKREEAQQVKVGIGEELRRYGRGARLEQQGAERRNEWEQQMETDRATKSRSSILVVANGCSQVRERLPGVRRSCCRD